MSLFVKRAGKFMRTLLASLNEATFTPLTAIEAPEVATEETGNVERTVKIMTDMQYVEQTTDANGVVSLRLTPAGARILTVFNGEG